MKESDLSMSQRVQQEAEFIHGLCFSSCLSSYLVTLMMDCDLKEYTKQVLSSPGCLWSKCFITAIVKHSRTASMRWWLLSSCMLPRAYKLIVLPHVPHLHSRQEEEDLTNELKTHITSIFFSSVGKHTLKDLLGN